MLRFQGPMQRAGIAVLVLVVLVLGYLGGDWLSSFLDQESAQPGDDHLLWQPREEFIDNAFVAQSEQTIYTNSKVSPRDPISTNDDVNKIDVEEDNDDSGEMQGGPQEAALQLKRTHIKRAFGNEQVSDEEMTKISELEQFYTKFNPSHIGDVPTIIARFQGRYDVLYAKLKHKYGASPADLQNQQRHDSESSSPIRSSDSRLQNNYAKTRTIIPQRDSAHLDTRNWNMNGQRDNTNSEEEDEEDEKEEEEKNGESEQINTDNNENNEIDDTMHNLESPFDISQEADVGNRFESQSKTQRTAGTKVKLICIGLERTGLGAIRRFLTKFMKLDVMFDDKVKENLGPILNGAVSNPEFNMFDGTQVVFGMASSAFFHEIVSTYPNAKVLVAVRDVDTWYKDMVKYVRTDFPAKLQDCRSKLENSDIPSEPSNTVTSFWASIIGGGSSKSKKQHHRGAATGVERPEMFAQTRADRCTEMEQHFNLLLEFVFGGDGLTVGHAELWKQRYFDFYDDVLSAIPRKRRKLIDLFSTEAGNTDRTWHWLAHWLGGVGDTDWTLSDEEQRMQVVGNEEVWNRALPLPLKHSEPSTHRPRVPDGMAKLHHNRVVPQVPRGGFRAVASDNAADGQLKVFLAGLPRTGSRAVALALQRIGYVTSTSSSSQSKLHDLVIASNSADGAAQKPWAFGYGGVFHGVDVAGGGGAAGGFFHPVLTQNPDCKFIVTVRDLESWWQSIRKSELNGFHRARNSHQRHTNSNKDNLSSFAPWIIGTGGSGGVASEYVAKARYRQHMSRLVRWIPPEKLLVIDVHRDTSATLWKEICMFLHESRCTNKIMSLDFHGPTTAE